MINSKLTLNGGTLGNNSESQQGWRVGARVWEED